MNVPPIEITSEAHKDHSGWNLTFSEGGQNCYVKQVRGFIGDMQLKTGEGQSMVVKVFPDYWKADNEFYTLACLVPVFVCMILCRAL